MSVLHEMLEVRRRRAEARHGPKPRYTVDGRRVSIRQMARECGVAEGTMRVWMERHRCGLEEAVRHYRRKQTDREYRQDEAARRERAAAEILEIIMEG